MSGNYDSDSPLVRANRRLKDTEEVEQRRVAAVASLRSFHDKHRERVQLIARRTAAAVIAGYNRQARLAAPPEMWVVKKLLPLARACNPRDGGITGATSEELDALQTFGLWCKRLDGTRFLTRREIRVLWSSARSKTIRSSVPVYDRSWATRDYFKKFIFGEELDGIGPDTRRSRLVALTLLIRAAISPRPEDDWIREWMVLLESDELCEAQGPDDQFIVGRGLRSYLALVQGPPSWTWVGRGLGWPGALSKSMMDLVSRRAQTPVDLHFLDLLEPVACLLGFDPADGSEMSSIELDPSSSLDVLRGLTRKWPHADLRRNGTDELTVAFLTALGSAGGAQVPAKALEAPLDRKERTIYEVASFLQAIDGGALIERRNRGYVLTDRGAWEYRALTSRGRRELRAN